MNLRNVNTGQLIHLLVVDSIKDIVFHAGNTQAERKEIVEILNERIDKKK